MSFRLVLSSAALIAAAASAGQGQRAPRQAAEAFTLDSVAPTPDAVATPAVTAPVAATPPPLATPALPENAAVATSPNSAAVIRGVFTLDTPIQALIANSGAKAVLDRDLPGMSDDENIDKFKMLSLRSLQPQTGGQLTDAMLQKVASDLNTLGGGAALVAMPAPAKSGNSKRNADTSR